MHLSLLSVQFQQHFDYRISVESVNSVSRCIRKLGYHIGLTISKFSRHCCPETPIEHPRTSVSVDKPNQPTSHYTYERGSFDLRTGRTYGNSVLSLYQKNRVHRCNEKSFATGMVVSLFYSLLLFSIGTTFKRVVLYEYECNNDETCSSLLHNFGQAAFKYFAHQKGQCWRSVRGGQCDDGPV